MKIEIEISDEMLDEIRDVIQEFSNVEVTLEDLADCELFQSWLACDIPNFYREHGIVPDMAESVDEMGLEEFMVEDDEDFDGVTIDVEVPNTDDWDWSVGYAPEDAPLPGETPEQTSKRLAKRTADNFEKWRNERKKIGGDDE